MVFHRKAYDKLKKWKEKYNGEYAALLEGARRVGKSTIATQFAEKNFKSYIKIDFANTSKEIKNLFDDISDLDMFFLKLQNITKTKLYKNKSVIIFDEIQLFPKARQAIKYLVQDKRYFYIETGSLISIKKNVSKILIPSEEYKIQIYPFDYEEFLLAINSNNYEMLRELYHSNKKIGDDVNSKLMRDLRLYIAIGGMPQAILAYTEGKSFEEIDFVKREIINLYLDDFRKIDVSGRVSKIYEGIPSQLMTNKKRFVISKALNKRKTSKDEELLYNLIDSKTILISYNALDPNFSLAQTKDFSTFKLFLADTGLFVTMLLNTKETINEEIYTKLLSDKLPANLGFLYENLAAQMIKASGRDLYFHTWRKPNSSHSFEIDFLLSNKNKIIPIEIKSSQTTHHNSILEFNKKYSKCISKQYLLSQKDVNRENELLFKPLYMLPFILEEN